LSDNHQRKRPERYKSGFGNYHQYNNGQVLSSGYTIRSTYRGLKKAWIGYKIAKGEDDYHKMLYYAEGIKKFQRELNLPVSSFPDLNMTESAEDKKKKLHNNKKQHTSNESL
jgi:hypothetical protein